MFDMRLIGRVNGDRVGKYPPETLLIVGTGAVKYRSTGWNHLPTPDGGMCRVADAGGNPPYPLVGMTEVDLDGVWVAEADLVDDPGAAT